MFPVLHQATHWAIADLEYKWALSNKFQLDLKNKNIFSYKQILKGALPKYWLYCFS